MNKKCVLCAKRSKNVLAFVCIYMRCELHLYNVSCLFQINCRSFYADYTDRQMLDVRSAVLKKTVCEKVPGLDPIIRVDLY